ncbi:hypothetical protein MHYP_G00241200 [Metynnis hypsauchen]
MASTGPETTTSKDSTVQEDTSATSASFVTTADHKLQTCSCGWRKVTSFQGLRIHQGKKRCLSKESQGPRIDLFLRKKSNQSNEVHQLDENHSLESISTPVREEENQSIELAVEETSAAESTQTPRPAVERRLPGYKLRVKWPGAAEKKLWEMVNDDLCRSLEQLRGTAEKKLENMGNIIYEYGAEHFGVLQPKVARQAPSPPVSRRQQKIKCLVQELRQLRKLWKKAPEVEKEGINILQAEIKTQLVSLRRAENFRKRRRKKEQTRTRFYKDSFKFLKTLFTKEKSGVLQTTKSDLEEHLRATHSDPKRHEHLTIPSDIPPIDPPEHQCETGPPTWKEVGKIVHRARAASAPGPNGVPYNVYKNAPDVCRFLWRLMRTVWQKRSIPKAWRRAGGILIPKEKNAANISQFRPIALLNVKGKIFFGVIAQRLAEYLRRNGYVDTSVQKAGISGFSGFLEHASLIWHQIQAAKLEKRELHAIFLDLANAFGSVPHELLWTAFRFFNIPDTITTLVKAYFQDLQFCFSTPEFTTSWQHLEIGIMAGCLYGDGVLKLPLTSLTEEFKCAKTRLQMTLNESQDPVVRENAPTLATGRKWTPARAVEEATAALRHADIVGNVQQGRGGLGLTTSRPAWRSAAPPARRKMVVEEVRRQEEAARWAKAVALGKQGRWTRWEGVEKRKMSWRDVWAMDAKSLSFTIKATYDVLPSPTNLHQWFGKDPTCVLCTKPASLRHILTGCKTSLTQGRYTWRHNQVLKILASTLEGKRSSINSQPLSTYKTSWETAFVREGATAARSNSKPSERSQLCPARDWKMLADVGKQLVFPSEIATTTLRPDLVLWSPSLRKVYMVELTVPWEDIHGGGI